MSEHHVHLVDGPTGVRAVLLPGPLDEGIAQWSGLRSAMIRQLPDGFRREEWAFVIQFLAAANLRAMFERSFGVATDHGHPTVVHRSRGAVGVWLPGNVSLLGPLVAVLLSLAGAPVRMKAPSAGDDLTSAFRRFALEHLGEGWVRYGLAAMAIDSFDRTDPRSVEMARESMVRVVFGGDDAVTAIDGLDHPLGSMTVAFADRASEAWVQRGTEVDAPVVAALASVRAVYGQAGCTSPRRVVVIDGTEQDAAALSRALGAAWPVGDEPQMHQATASVASLQLALAAGCSAERLADGRAVLAVGPPDTELAAAADVLLVTAADEPRARGTAPANLQTVGIAAGDRWSPDLVALTASTSVSRVVPVAQMHHFGSLWDGYDLLRCLFEDVEVT